MKDLSKEEWSAGYSSWTRKEGARGLVPLTLLALGIMCVVSIALMLFTLMTTTRSWTLIG